jgi:hypothetical protein
MALKNRNFEKAVEGLLSPHNYEYMLFVQSQLKNSPHRFLSQNSPKAQDIVRIVQAVIPSTTLSSSVDALRVLREAVRRLK